MRKKAVLLGIFFIFVLFSVNFLSITYQTVFCAKTSLQKVLQSKFNNKQAYKVLDAEMDVDIPLGGNYSKKLNISAGLIPIFQYYFVKYGYLIQSTNPIECMILTEDNFIKWNNSQPFEKFWNRTHLAIWDVNIEGNRVMPPINISESYYFILDDVFGSLVNVDIFGLYLDEENQNLELILIFTMSQNQPFTLGTFEIGLICFGAGIAIGIVMIWIYFKKRS